MALKKFEDLFVDELKDVYDAERRITKALPKMAREATNEELVAAMEEHLEQTQEHIQRLDRIFEMIDKTPGRKTCEAMVGLLEEGQELMNEEAPDAIKDAALIAAAQKVEHYEIATYGCLRDWAKLLGNDEAVQLLQQTLDEEGETDKRLSEIAMTLNVEARDSEEEEEEPETRETVTAGRRSGGSSQQRSGSTGGRSRSR